MSHVLVSTCRFLSRQRLCCQLGYFFFFIFFFFSPPSFFLLSLFFFFFFPAAILEWFPAGGWQAALAGDHLPG